MRPARSSVRKPWRFVAQPIVADAFLRLVVWLRLMRHHPKTLPLQCGSANSIGQPGSDDLRLSLPIQYPKSKNIVPEARNVGRGREKTAKKSATWLLTLALRVSVTFGCGSLITRDFHFGQKLVERRPKITRNRLSQKQLEFLTLSAARVSRQLGPNGL